MAKEDSDKKSAKSEGTKSSKGTKGSKAEGSTGSKREGAKETKGSSGGGGSGKTPPRATAPSYGADDVRWDDLAGRVIKPALAVGVIGLGLAWFVGNSAGDGMRHFSFAYLTAYIYVATIALGTLWFVILQHLVNANWSVAVRRVAEIFAANLPVLVILALPIVVPVLMGDHTLYPWNDHDAVQKDHLLHAKEPYLNSKFFGIRCVIYFGFWFWISSTLLKRSVEQDGTGNAAISKTLGAICAPSMLVFALTLTFFAFDFLMSLEPVFYSTIFGVYVFAGCVMSSLAAMALSLMWLQKNGKLTKTVTTEHYHDIGKLMFAFGTVFWAYIAFSQFMLIWYADIPEETFWYKLRFAGEWGNVSWALLFGHFVIPFLGFMSRTVKRSRTGLAFWSAWLLVMHYIDMYWLVTPALRTEQVPFGLTDAFALFGVLGFFIASAAFTGQKLNLLCTKDPRLAKSLAFENI